MNSSLKTYFVIADMIAGTFGGQCEVVIHDLSKPEGPVVHAANGSVTGKRPGQSPDCLTRRVLLNKSLRDDRMTNCMFETPEDKRIKSSYALLRDCGGQVIGVMCINYDVTACQAMQSWLNVFLSEANPGMALEKDGDQDVMAVIDRLMLKLMGSVDGKDISRKRSIEIIKLMDEKGIFLVKGAVDKVAALMGISKVTVYSYLEEAKGKRRD